MFTHVEIMPSCTRVAIPIRLEYYVRVTQECIDWRWWRGEWQPAGTRNLSTWQIFSLSVMRRRHEMWSASRCQLLRRVLMWEQQPSVASLPTRRCLTELELLLQLLPRYPARHREKSLKCVCKKKQWVLCFCHAFSLFEKKNYITLYIKTNAEF